MTSSGSARSARRNAASPESLSDAPAVSPPVWDTKAKKPSKKAVKVNGAEASVAAPESAKTSPARDDKDRPLFEDIRYLGRLLGDVLREQEGDAVFDVVETIRQTAVKFRREDDVDASQTLEKKLRALSPEQTVSVVRAFSYFSHLANIAEDRHHNRRRRIHALAGSTAQAGTIAYAIEPDARAEEHQRAAQAAPKVFRCRADRARAHRASDRSVAQEHSRCAARYRAPARRTRSGTDPALACAQRSGAARA